MKQKEQVVNFNEQEDEYICCCGSFQDIVSNIVASGLLPKELAVESLNYLMENLDLLETDKESILTKQADDSVRIDGSGFMVGDTNFYIKLQKSTILLACMLVSSITMSFISSDIISLITPFMVGGMIGNASHLGFRVYEESGEKCVIHKLASKRPTVILPKDIKKMMGKKCEENYNCYFKKNGKCKCEISDIINICETLRDRGAVVKSGDCYGYRM